MATKRFRKSAYKKGDKVIHTLSEDDEMVGTVLKRLPNDRYLVEFFIPGRRKKGYFTELEFSVKELSPCFVETERTKTAASM